MGLKRIKSPRKISWGGLVFLLRLLFSFFLPIFSHAGWVFWLRLLFSFFFPISSHVRGMRLFLFSMSHLKNLIKKSHKSHSLVPNTQCVFKVHEHCNNLLSWKYSIQYFNPNQKYQCKPNWSIDKLHQNLSQLEQQMLTESAANSDIQLFILKKKIITFCWFVSVNFQLMLELLSGVSMCSKNYQMKRSKFTKT